MPDSEVKDNEAMQEAMRLSQLQEILQFEFPEDTTFEGQLGFYKEHPDKLAISPEEDKPMPSIGQEGVDWISEIYELIAFSRGVPHWAAHELSSAVGGIGEHIGEWSHAQSPFSRRPPTKAEREFQKKSGLGQFGSELAYTAARYPYGIMAFLTDIPNMLLNPNEYIKEGEDTPPSRLSLMNDVAYGLAQMIKDLPAQIAYSGMTGVGAQPTEEEVRAWEEAGVLGRLLFGDAINAIDRLHESPESMGYGILIARGAGRMGRRMAVGKKVGVAEQAIRGQEKGRQIEAYRLQKEQADKTINRIAENYAKIKPYRNSGESGGGLPIEVNDAILQVRTKALTMMAELEGAGRVVEDLQQFKFEKAMSDLQAVSQKWTEAIIAQKRRPTIRKEVTFRQFFTTPRRLIPEVYFPTEKMYSLMMAEENIITKARNEILKPIKSKEGAGKNVGQFLNALETWEVEAHLNGQKYGIKHKGKIYEFDETTEAWRVFDRDASGNILKKEGKPQFQIVENPEILEKLSELDKNKYAWLKPDELRLAGFDRALTDMVATRSGLKESGKYIDTYTTWLRDDLMFHEGLEESGAQHVPIWAQPYMSTKVYNRFFEHRGPGEAPPTLNTNETIPLYTHFGLRKIYIEPVIKELTPVINALPSNKASYARDWINIIKGKKKIGVPERATFGIQRGLVQKFPRLGETTLGKPYLYDRATRKVMSAYYHSMLGLALDSALKNMTQVSLSLATLDSRAMMNGLWTFLREGPEEPRQLRVIDEFTNIFERPDIPGASKIWTKLSDVVMAPFQWAEVWNRGVTYFAAKEYFMRKGKPELLADEYARSFVDRRAAEFAKIVTKETQFEYGRYGTSPTLQGPTLRLFGQFTSFPLKHIETMMDWKRNDKRALMRYISLCGIMMMTANELGFDVSEVFGLNVYPNFLNISRGYSPMGQATLSIAQSLIDFSKGKPYAARNALEEELIKFIPAQRMGRKLIKIFDSIKRGDVRDKYGNFYKATTLGEQIKYLFGLKDDELNDIYDNIGRQYRTKKRFQDVKMHFKQKFGKACGNDDIKGAVEALLEMREEHPLVFLTACKEIVNSVEHQDKPKHKRAALLESDEFMQLIMFYIEQVE